MTVFDLFTFFCSDLIQWEDSWKLSSTSDWLLSTWQNTFELCAVSERVNIDFAVTWINWVWSRNTFAFKNLSRTQAGRTWRPTIGKCEDDCRHMSSLLCHKALRTRCLIDYTKLKQLLLMLKIIPGVFSKDNIIQNVEVS